MDELRFKKWFKDIVADSGAKIENSDCFMSLFTPNYKQSPQCALELGIAIMLDKPIALLVSKGTTVPAVLERIATAIEFCDSDDPEEFHQATKRLLKKVGMK